MTPRRRLAAAQARLDDARRRVAAREPGWDPWRVAAAQAAYEAALGAALGDPSPATSLDADTPPELRHVPRLGRSWGRGRS